MSPNLPLQALQLTQRSHASCELRRSSRQPADRWTQEIAVWASSFQGNNSAVHTRSAFMPRLTQTHQAHTRLFVHTLRIFTTKVRKTSVRSDEPRSIWMRTCVCVCATPAESGSPLWRFMSPLFCKIPCQCLCMESSLRYKRVNVKSLKSIDLTERVLLYNCWNRS